MDKSGSQLRTLGIFHICSNIEDYRDNQQTGKIHHHTSSYMYKVMAIGSNGEKRTRILLNFNIVKQRKVDEEQDENDQGSNRGKVCFVGPSPTLLATPAT